MTPPPLSFNSKGGGMISSAAPAVKKPLFAFGFKKKDPVVPKNLTPKVRAKALPGPRSRKMAEALRRYESPNVTYVSEHWPVFLQKGAGCNLWDVDGNRFLDLTSAFGVCGIGHAPTVLRRTLHEQARLMIHGMGDVHPNEAKVALAKALADLAPGNLSQTIFSSTGSEAVESALKTAVMHTKKTGVIAFEGAYHGLGYGALNVTHRADFRKPFEKQLARFAQFAPFPDPRRYGPKATETVIKAMGTLVSRARRSAHPVGAVILEPIQGRGGVMVPPPDFLKALRVFCDENKILLIADEVLTGFGRTGFWFAVQKSDVVPDILCLGKGMGGGLPVSACMASPRVMYSWGASGGDAVHTSTYLGHPLGAAAALAVIREIESKRLIERSKTMGDLFRKELWKLKEKYPLIGDVRGAGLLIGLEFQETGYSAGYSGTSRKFTLPPPATAKAKMFVLEALRHGLIVLPSGPDHNVISIMPPLVIGEPDIAFAVKAFDSILKKLV